MQGRLQLPDHVRRLAVAGRRPCRRPRLRRRRRGLGRPTSSRAAISPRAAAGAAPPATSAGSPAAGGAAPSRTPGTTNPAPAPTTAGAPPGTPAPAPPAPVVDLALHRPTGESSHTQQYAGANATDGDTATYWESTDGAFPQWLQVDLGTVVPPARLVVRLPQLPAWQARTQTLSVEGSPDGAAFSTLVGSTTYRFDPATGNQATVRLPGTPTRFLRLVFTDNSVRHGGQIFQLQVY